jgi:hypothetical protein
MILPVCNKMRQIVANECTGWQVDRQNDPFWRDAPD